MLCHFFIPTFNLLEVKLTRDAQTELLQLFDVVIQYDMDIMSQCHWLMCGHVFDNAGKATSPKYMLFKCKYRHAKCSIMNVLLFLR